MSDTYTTKHWPTSEERAAWKAESAMRDQLRLVATIEYDDEPHPLYLKPSEAKAILWLMDQR